LRLLLIQVQQLKVGLISALDNIDALLQNNRINFQILAAVPAAFLVYYLARFLVRVAYNIRAKDFRPVTVVHTEMLEVLEKIESIILLNGHENYNGTSASSMNLSSCDENGGSRSIVDPRALGEMTLNMHVYLVHLNYSCPPFPSRQCDIIHRWVVELLGPDLQREGVDRQTEWLRRIKQKHQDLLEYL